MSLFSPTSITQGMEFNADNRFSTESTKCDLAAGFSHPEHVMHERVRKMGAKCILNDSVLPKAVTLTTKNLHAVYETCFGWKPRHQGYASNGWYCNWEWRRQYRTSAEAIIIVFVLRVVWHVKGDHRHISRSWKSQKNQHWSQSRV